MVIFRRFFVLSAVAAFCAAHVVAEETKVGGVESEAQGAARKNFSSSSLPTEKVTPQEVVHLKRIKAFWQDGAYENVKTQILDFLNKYPDSAVSDSLNAMLGDLYYQHGHYKEAVEAYSRIQGEPYAHMTACNWMQSLFELHDYVAVVSAAQDYFESERKTDEERDLKICFLLAEALFRQTLTTDDEAQKRALALQARPQYKALIGSDYEELTLFPLAEIHRLLQEYPKAAALYLSLAERHPEKAEELLFQVAAAQVHFNKDEAAQTFAKICKLNGSKAPAAAYNLMLILFEQERYAELILTQDNICKHLPPGKAAQLDFYLGRAYFAMKNYKSAVAPLNQFVQATEESAPQLRAALLTLVVCAQQTHDLDLLKNTLSRFRTAFPQDPQIAQALLLQAQLAAQTGDLAQAEDCLKEVLAQFPQSNGRETALYDYGVILAKGKHWTDSRAVFLEFVQHFPASKLHAAAWRYIMHASISALNSNSDDAEKRQLLAQDLSSVLSQNGLLSEDERRSLGLLYVRTLYQLERYPDVLENSTAYLEAYPLHPKAAEVHLLMALCYQKLGRGGMEFIKHAEKALMLDQTLADKGLLHIHLYNAYRTAAGDDTADASALIDKAAEHLYQGTLCNAGSIKLENLIWLANYYYRQAKNSHSDVTALERAAALFVKALDTPIAHETLFLENEFLKYADLLTLQGKAEAKIQLLENLSSQQQRDPNMGWKLQRQTLFELAKSYESAKANEKALKTYELLISSAAYPTSFITQAATLQSARLKFALLPEGQRRENDPALAEILNALKDLQIKKNLQTEPIHLEAALEYADIRTALALATERVQKALFFLERIKEDFTAETDTLTKTYHAACARYPDKAALLNTYLIFIDVEIVRLKAEIARQNGELEAAQSLDGSALSGFQELLQKELTSYLHDRTQNSMETLRS